MSAANDVLAALGYALFVREAGGASRLQGEAPEWLRTLWPELAESSVLPVEKASPFLENFLIDAAEAWQSGGETRAASGPWIETLPDGSEVTLEATALTAKGAPIFLLERTGAAFEQKKAMLQKARETVIAYQRLHSEMQKKDVLLSWIAEQMNASLANVITSLRLIEAEDNPPRTRQLLHLAVRAADEQQALIHKILVMFEAELEGLYARSDEARRGANVRDVLGEAQAEVAAQFEERRVRFVPAGQGANGARVALDPAHLKRILISFLETALDSARGEVALETSDEGDSIRVRVTNDGPPLAPDICEGLFAKDSTDPAALRLQFCRIAVESCGGEIGCERREPTGNHLWVRLPKVSA